MWSFTVSEDIEADSIRRESLTSGNDTDFKMKDEYMDEDQCEGYDEKMDFDEKLVVWMIFKKIRILNELYKFEYEFDVKVTNKLIKIKFHLH